jgi:hypothetical protein
LLRRASVDVANFVNPATARFRVFADGATNPFVDQSETITKDGNYGVNYNLGYGVHGIVLNVSWTADGEYRNYTSPQMIVNCGQPPVKPTCKTNPNMNRCHHVCKGKSKVVSVVRRGHTITASQKVDMVDSNGKTHHRKAWTVPPGITRVVILGVRSHDCKAHTVSFKFEDDFPGNG